eukprot:CAMPEP_0198130334 /NCGR_PEP_ID=MMETSP1442-20131203/53700_1 /TAXON_ID= /ORGANISM="Craspedostauros australis, Strain CCMP3328" /LENGTH=206 /DNA_ID=CAMNT_0043790921 /DNA_START=557 /DNA_END=1173 /DNA_ORIENTATION=-
MKFFDLISAEQIALTFDDDERWSLLEEDETDKLLDTNSSYGIDDAHLQDGDATSREQANVHSLLVRAEQTQAQRSAKRSSDGNGKTPTSNHGAALPPSKRVLAEPPNEAWMDAEEIQAREMTELSLKERSDVYEDIHGVRQPVEETEALRQKRLQQLEIELTVGLYDSKRKYRLPIEDKSMRDTYVMVSFLSPRITSDNNNNNNNS